MVLSVPLIGHADPYETLAKDLSRFAGRVSAKRVAVLPFVDVGGGDSEASVVLSERLLTRLAGDASLQVVERTLLKSVVEEQGLGHRGWIDPRQTKQLGRILGVDAVVTGTFLRLATGELEVNARLIDAQTARILGAAAARVRYEWTSTSFTRSDGPIVVEPPRLGWVKALFGRRERDDLQDSPADGASDCGDWETRVYALQEGSLEMKARYWASKFREAGFSPRRLTRNPGSEVRSLELRQSLYARIKELYNAGYTAGLADSDLRELEAAEGKVEGLVKRCNG
ncbi:MAG: hypothetical protein HY078_06910 [Elusimicrobia bacterium]|nr:hypothetical protein [Elusimicrobiota bacterium]